MDIQELDGSGMPRDRLQKGIRDQAAERRRAFYLDVLREDPEQLDAILAREDSALRQTNLLKKNLFVFLSDTHLRYTYLINADGVPTHMYMCHM